MPNQVIPFLDLLWKQTQTSTSHSWLKLNHAMHDGLALAIRSGMTFEEEDFSLLGERYNFSRWAGDIEQLYGLAVIYRNNSAWKSIESYLGRRPFIVSGAWSDVHTGDGPAGQGLARLIVGARFKWKRETVTVTSFPRGNGLQSSVCACSYEWGEPETCPVCKRVTKSPEKRLLHRYTITHEMIRDDKAGRKEALPAVEVYARVP